MKHIIILILISCFSLTACNKVKKATKDTINKSGQVVGESATEFLDGVADGVNETLNCEVQISDELKAKGIEVGKFYISSTAKTGTKNQLTIYFSASQNIDEEATVKISDAKGKEYGRAIEFITLGENEAAFFDFTFDERTKIEKNSTFIIE